MYTKIDKISNGKRKFLNKKISINSFFSKNNNQSNLDKEKLAKLIDEYFKEFDEYEIID